MLFIFVNKKIPRSIKRAGKEGADYENKHQSSSYKRQVKKKKMCGAIRILYVQYLKKIFDTDEADNTNLHKYKIKHPRYRHHPRSILLKQKQQIQ